MVLGTIEEIDRWELPMILDTQLPSVWYRFSDIKGVKLDSVKVYLTFPRVYKFKSMLGKFFNIRTFLLEPSEIFLTPILNLRKKTLIPICIFYALVYF